ncbi:DUF982 domain-containing protein [Mesorhizobium sp. M1312]|uniref:DUF982 domain-containing protein n=1 Tax=unclassified Mesorhizobium TaxID=325217 RepID=UPI00333862F7
MCVGREIDHWSFTAFAGDEPDPRHAASSLERDELARHHALATLLVLSVSDAAEVLLRTRLATIEACLAVVRGEKPPRVARQAFIVAAKDARILLGEQI